MAMGGCVFSVWGRACCDYRGSLTAVARLQLNLYSGSFNEGSCDFRSTVGFGARAFCCHKGVRGGGTPNPKTLKVGRGFRV